MSFYFLREWSQFNSQNWVNPDPEFVKNKESNANSLSEVVLPVFVELSEAPTLSVELEKTYENRFKRRLTNLQGLEEGKHAALQQIDWKSSTIVEDLRVIDPAFAKVWEESRTSSEEENAQHEASLFSSVNGEHIFLQSLVYYIGKNDNRFVGCLKKLMELPSYKDEALRVLLMYYKETQQFDVIEAMTNSVVESERELEQETVLLLVYSQIQVLIRKKAYDEALTRLDRVRPLSDNNALFDALRAHILLKKHVAGESIAKVCEYMESALGKAKEFPLTAGWMQRSFRELKVEFVAFLRHPAARESLSDGKEGASLDLKSAELSKAQDHYHAGQYREAILTYEKYFFSIWHQANPYFYSGDRLLNGHEKENAVLYLKCLIKIYDNNISKIILHLQTLLDSFVIPTQWKQSFAEILMGASVAQSLVASNEQFGETLTSMVKSLESLGNSLKTTFNISGLGTKKPNLTKRISTNETIAQYLNLFGTNPRQSGVRDVSFQQEVTDTFCDEFKSYLRTLIETFYHEHETGFEKLSFSAHFKKAKTEKNLALATMHYIGMTITQTGKEPDSVLEDVQNILSNLFYQDRNHKALLILCALSINDFRVELDYKKLSEKFPLEVSLFKGFNYFREKDLDNALKSFKEAYKIDSHHPLVLLGLATCYFCKKDLGIAAVCFQKLMRIDRRLANQAALYALASLRDLGDVDSIKSFLFGLKDVDFEPNHELKILSRHLFIDLFFYEGHIESGLEWLEMYAQAEPNDPFILIHQATEMLSEVNDGGSIVRPESLYHKALKFYDKREWSAPLKATFGIKHASYLNCRLKNMEAWEIAKKTLPYASNEEMLSWYQLVPLLTSTSGKVDLSKLRTFIANGFNEKSQHAAYLNWAAWCHIKSRRFELDKIIPLFVRAILKNPSGSLHANCYLGMLIAYFQSNLHSDGSNQLQINPSIYKELSDSILNSPKRQLILKNLFLSEIKFQYSLNLYKLWLRKYHYLPFAFTAFVETANQAKRQVEALEVLKELEKEFPNNCNLLTAIATLETSEGRRRYIDLCLSLNPDYEPLRYLIARDLLDKNRLKAIEEFERSFRFAHKKTQPDFYFAYEKLSKETIEDVSSYVKCVYQKYQNGAQAKKHIREFTKFFNDGSEWSENFHKAVEENIAKLIPKVHSSKPRHFPRLGGEAPERIHSVAAEIIQKPVDAPTPAAVVSTVSPKQERGVPKSFLEADPEEEKLQEKLKKAKEESRKLAVNMLHVADITLEKRSRLKEDDIIKNVRTIAEQSRVIHEEEPVVLPQPKVRERYIPTEQKEVVVPMATTILTQAKPAAASKDFQQDVFALIADAERDRLNQAYSNLSVMQGELTRVDKPEYHPDLQEFIMQRAMMYQLLRLGEALFPQSASVRKTLSPVYQPTMEKLISSTMISAIRNQLRHEYMNVTFAKVVNTCRYVVESNLKQNVKLWHDFNLKPHNIGALIKTVLPESCLVADPTVKVIPLVFLGSELRKLGSLLDKISHDVLAMNPDIVYAVKMSVCMLCEMAKREEFKGRIKGLERFILAGNKIAHEFGEDCEFYSFDEISLFDIRPYVLLAREVHEANFPKTTGVLSAKAPAFVMGKKP